MARRLKPENRNRTNREFKRHQAAQNRPMPKLSLLDNTIYGILSVLLFVVTVCPLLLPILLKENLSFRDSQVVAFSGNGDLWGLIPMFFLFMMTIIFMAVYWGKRYPIFGRKDVSYGPPRYPSIYPMLWKNKPQVRRSGKEIAQDKKETRTMVTVLVTILVVTLALGALAYCGRETLHRDGTVVVYNSLNRETVTQSPGELTAARVDTYRHSHGRHYTRKNYSVELNLEFADGSTYRFILGNFRGDDLEALQTLLTLKEQYGSLFQVGNTTYLLDVVRDRNLTPEEEGLLYRLFDWAG